MLNLKQATLCVSGDRFDADQRQAVQRAVEAAGGRYSTQLDATCTHLVTSGPGGAKNDALLAMAHPTAVRVTPAWLHDSLMKGVAQVFVEAGSIDAAKDSYENAVNTGPLQAAHGM